MSSLQGKLIAITGAASGIGLATASHLYSLGCLLSLADLSTPSLATAVSDILASAPHDPSSPPTASSAKDASQARIYTHALDVRSPAQVAAWLSATTAHFDRPLDGAANLAGVIGQKEFSPQGGILDLEDRDWEFVMGVNATGVMNCLRGEVRGMVAAFDAFDAAAADAAAGQSAAAGGGGGGGGGGAGTGKGGRSIVNASSVAGLRGGPTSVAYNTSKHAVIGMTRSVAREVGAKGIRVNAIAPGIIQSPMMDQLVARAQTGSTDPLTQNCAIKRAASALEVAKLIAFLLSDDSSYITGSVQQIDGGMWC